LPNNLELLADGADDGKIKGQFFRRGGRAVDRAGLENRKAERPREFESHPLRFHLLGEIRRLATDYANRRIVDDSARRRLPPGPVDFVAVNNSKRRNRCRADRLQFNTLWDKRTGDENRLLFNVLLTFGSLVHRGIGEHRSSKHAGCHQDYGALPYRPPHKQNYTREVMVCKLLKR
jgi:hypothetical protein